MDTSSGPVELADPLQILVDVSSAQGPDAAEAAAVVRRAVLSEPLTTRLRDWLLDISTITTAAPHRGGWSEVGPGRVLEVAGAGRRHKKSAVASEV